MWNQYRGNAQKQGHSGSVDEVLGPSGNLSVQLWKRSGPTFAGFVSSPIITSKGVAIVGDLDARVYAVQVNTGGLLWSTAQALGEYLSSSASLSENEEIVYMSAFVMSTNSAIFYEIGTANGTVISSTTIPGMPVGSSTSAFSSFAMYKMDQPPAMLAITAFGDKIFALHTTDYYDSIAGDHFHPGYQKWNYSDAFNSSYSGAAGSDLNIQSTPAIDGNYAYFATPAGEVIALDCRDGVEQWRVYTGGYLGSSPVVDPFTQRLYITGTRGMHALTLEEGISPDDRLLVSFATQTTISSAALTVDGSTLYFATSAGTLYAIDLDATFEPLMVPRRRRGRVSVADVTRTLLTTQVKWQTALGSAVQLSSPVVDSQGNVYLGTAAGFICAVNASGALLWSRQPSGSAVYGSASLAGNHTLVIGTQDGLYAFYAAPPTPSASPAKPPVSAAGQTDFPESAIWVLFGVLISLCFVTSVYLCYGYQRERKKHRAKLHSEEESVTLEEVHRANGGATGGAGSRGLRSVWSSETSSNSTATTVRVSAAEVGSKRSGWASSAGFGSGFWMDRPAGTKGRDPAGGDESIDHPLGETTGKWDAPGSRPARVRSISTLSMTSRDTSQLPPPSYKERRARVARYAGGGGGQAATLANAVEAYEDSSRPTTSTSSDGSNTGGGEPGSGSGFGSVRGLFALLGLRRQAQQARVSPPPQEAPQESPAAGVSVSQEIVEIRVISPSPSPTRTSRAASLLWRDSADGTAMFSRKASGSVATGVITADGSEGHVGGARGRGGTETSLPSHSEMRAQSSSIFTEEPAAQPRPQPKQRLSKATKMAVKRRKKAMTQWESTLQSDSRSDSTVQSSPFHKAPGAGKGSHPVENPSQAGSRHSEVESAPLPSTYRYSGSGSGSGSGNVKEAAGVAATEVDPSWYVSSDSGTHHSYSLDPRASVPGEGGEDPSQKEDGSASASASASGEESPYWTNRPVPADSLEFRKSSLLAAAAAAGGQRALSSIHSGGTGSTSTPSASAELEELHDDVLTASVTVRDGTNTGTDLDTDANAGVEAAPPLTGSGLSVSYAESFVPSVDGADAIPMSPVSNVPSVTEIPREAREPLDEQQLSSRGLQPLEVLPGGSPAWAGAGPSLRSPTKLGNPRVNPRVGVLSLRMPDESFASSLSSMSTLHDLSATMTSLPSHAPPPPPPAELSSGEGEGEDEGDDSTAYFG